MPPSLFCNSLLTSQHFQVSESIATCLSFSRVNAIVIRYLIYEILFSETNHKDIFMSERQAGELNSEKIPV